MQKSIQEALQDEVMLGKCGTICHTHINDISETRLCSVSPKSYFLILTFYSAWELTLGLVHASKHFQLSYLPSPQTVV
jgi:hypothetical protein